MVSSPPLYPSPIPDSVHPPIPGESHRFYGNSHIKEVKLPENAHSDLTNEYGLESSNQELNIHEAAAAGKLRKVQELFADGDNTKSFLLANNAKTTTGLTPLHYAASRGHFDVVKWLVDSAGAIVDLEDITGETALLKASLAGHDRVVEFLLMRDAKVDLKDSDGWTALHNAASQGHLQIVKYLLQHTNAAVDIRSNIGHTPLMNAASKGHADVVKYLLERNANPLTKNPLGETAYDIAAASRELHVCEILERAEREWWKGKRTQSESPLPGDLSDSPVTNQPYDVVAIHITIPAVLYENQRSSSFPILRGPHKFSSSTLLKSDSCGPWSLPDGKPMTKDQYPFPSSGSGKDSGGWVWISTWEIDMSRARIDAEGWQYARSFDEPEEMWTEAPSGTTGRYVRRRRWIRIMKRLDEPTDENDYVAKAKAVIDKGKTENRSSASDELEWFTEAIEILKEGIEKNPDSARNYEATALMTSYLQQAEHLKTFDNQENGVIQTPLSPRDIPTTPSTLLPSSSLFYKLKSPDNTLSNFTNIKASSSTSLSSLQTIENGWSTNPQSEDVGNSSSLFEGTSGLGSPTRPQTALSTATASVTGLNSSRKWENDEDVVECRRCFKKFGFITRRHHCRKCGQVVCDRCSTARVPLPPNQVLRDPSEVTDTSTSSFYRVCDSCFRTIDLHNRQRSGSTTASINSTSSMSRQRRRDSSSSIFDCPVCGVQLKDIPGGKAAEEEHIKNCLESKNGNNISGYKYVGEQTGFCN